MTKKVFEAFRNMYFSNDYGLEKIQMFDNHGILVPKTGKEITFIWKIDKIWSWKEDTIEVSISYFNYIDGVRVNYNFKTEIERRFIKRLYMYKNGRN